MTEELNKKLESIISGHSINEDDADWLRALTQRPAAQTEREALRWTVYVEPVAVSGEPDAHCLRASIGNQAFHIGPDYMDTKQEAELFAEMFLHAIEVGHRASLPAAQQATPRRATREAEQRARMQARLAARHEGKATADFDLPAQNDAPQQATPETLTRFCPGCGSVGEVPDSFRDCCPDGAKARLIPASLAHHCRDLFILALGAAKESATPEPVGEPWGWAVNSTLFRGEFAEADAKAEAKRCGGTTRAVALYDRPAPGVPDGLPAVLTDWGFDVHDDEDGRTWLTIRNPDDDVARMSVPTVWPLNGNQTIGAVVLHQFSAALTSALAAAQAKGAGQ